MQFEITPEFLASQGLSPDFQERFWSKVFIMTEGSGCWIWTGWKDVNGYGIILRIGTERKNRIRAHVASWILANGPDMHGLHVLHDCPNGDLPACVNPSHLWLGTQYENIQDMIEKGRNPKGESNGSCKLTAEKVLEIRRRHIPRIGTNFGNTNDLAEEFGVCRENILAIVARKSWHHI